MVDEFEGETNVVII